MPSQAASSGFISRRLLPLNKISPRVTSYVWRRDSTCASVLFPEPFGPIMECTSPALMVRSTPLRISCPSTLACRFLILSRLISLHLHESVLPDAAFEAHTEQLLCLHCKLHGKFPENLFAKAVDNHGNGLLRFETALAQVKELVFTNL